MTDRLPTVVVSSVIRSTHQGESHGGVYLVDLASGTVDQVVDWDDAGISWEGRGADRGLRGIAFHGDEVYLAASDEVFVYDRSFQQQRSFRNRYLKHCHEICIHDGRLFLTSTGYDSILEVDLGREEFVAGYHFARTAGGRVLQKLPGVRVELVPRMAGFDPLADGGPSPGDTLHINNVHVDDTGRYWSGTQVGHLVRFGVEGAGSYARIPMKTHNARPFRDGVLANHTSTNAVALLTRDGVVVRPFPIPSYNPSALLNTDLPSDHARQAFGRGLAVHEERWLIGGSSPATVTVHDLGTGEQVTSVNLTLDVRNAVHGLEVWPW